MLFDRACDRAESRVICIGLASGAKTSEMSPGESGLIISFRNVITSRGSILHDEFLAGLRKEELINGGIA